MEKETKCDPQLDVRQGEGVPSQVWLIYYDKHTAYDNFFLKLQKNVHFGCHDSSEPFGYGRVITQGKKVESVVEEINARPHIKNISLCNSGIMLCKYGVLFSFIKNINDKNLKKEKYLTDIFKIAHKNNNSFSFWAFEVFYFKNRRFDVFGLS